MTITALITQNPSSRKASTHNGNFNLSGYIGPPINLFGENLQKCLKDNSLTIKLGSNPGDAHSGSYELTISILDSTETPWQAVHWQKQLERIWTGQAIDNGKQREDMAQRCMTGQHLVVLDTSVDKSIDTRWEGARETAEVAGQVVPARPVEATLRREDLNQALKEVRTYLMPCNAGCTT